MFCGFDIMQCKSSSILSKFIYMMVYFLYHEYDSQSHRYNFRDCLFSASTSRYGWNIAKVM